MSSQDEPSEYEKQRLRNIERNNAVMALLGLQNTAQKKRLKQQNKNKNKNQKRPRDGVRMPPTRRTGRVTKTTLRFGVDGFKDLVEFEDEKKDEGEDEHIDSDNNDEEDEYVDSYNDDDDLDDDTEKEESRPCKKRRQAMAESSSSPLLFSSSSSGFKFPHTKRSEFVGVCWDAKHEAWEAKIQKKGGKKNLGLFKKEYDAACAFDKAAARLGKPVNFPKEGQVQAKKRRPSRPYRAETTGSPPKTSAFVGLTWDRHNAVWQVRMRVKGKTCRFGTCIDEVEAAKLYDKHAALLGKPVNFPTEAGQEQALKSFRGRMQKGSGPPKPTGQAITAQPKGAGCGVGAAVDGVVGAAAAAAEYFAVQQGPPLAAAGVALGWWV